VRAEEHTIPAQIAARAIDPILKFKIEFDEKPGGPEKCKVYHTRELVVAPAVELHVHRCALDAFRAASPVTEGSGRDAPDRQVVLADGVID
jgi:tryptophanyl-tRNA synthetase